MYRSSITSDISKEKEESPAHLVLRDHQVQRVRKDTMGQEAIGDPRDHRDPPAVLDHRGLQDHLEMESTYGGVGFRGQMKRVQGPWLAALSLNLLLCLETQECAVLEASVVPLVYLVKPEKKDLKETLDYLGHPVIKGTGVSRADQENRVPPDRMVHEVPPGPSEKRAIEGLMVFPE